MTVWIGRLRRHRLQWELSNVVRIFDLLFNGYVQSTENEISREYNIGVTEEIDRTEVPIELLLLAIVEIGIFQVEFRQNICLYFLVIFYVNFSSRHILPPAQNSVQGIK